MKNWPITAWTLAAVTLVSLAGTAAFYRSRPYQEVQDLLRLDHAPASFKNGQCEYWGANDLLATCVFEIDPAEFPVLLSNWRFVRRSVNGSSHDFSGGPKLGAGFAAATEYSANPPEFRHGGLVSIVTDREQSHVQLSYYEE